MKIKSFLFSSVFLVSSLFANDLAKMAMDSGITPLPKDKLQLKKLIEDYSPDSKNFPTTTAAVELGKKLYFEPRLSKSGIISCNTCHNLGLGGVDGIPASTGHKWRPNPHHVNAPTVYNSVFNSVQFWDGRAAHLAAQAMGPIEAADEMAASASLVVNRLKSMPSYVKEFKDVFNSEISFDLIATAIGIFERTLVTPSRFDMYLQGDKNALSKAEKDGLRVFIDKGCASCHNGVNLGGTLQPFEIMEKYKFANIGDFKGDENGLVKTPTLRNVELTAPYFHNGAIWSLKEAVQAMGSIQLGIKINDKDAQSIVVFLKSLTGKMPSIVYPTLPASTDKTSKPDLEY